MREAFLRLSCAWLPILVACLLTAALLAACNAHRDTRESHTATTTDPCALVTRADAERILGARVKPAIRHQTVLMATGRECDYVTAAPTGSAGGVWGIDLTVYDDATVRSPDSMFKSAADYFRRDMAALRSSGTTLVPVPRLGDVAYWQPGSDLLHVLDRGVYVMLDVDADFHAASGTDEQTDQQLDTAKRAAEITLVQDTILPRLANSTSLSTSQPPAGGRGGQSS